MKCHPSLSGSGTQLSCKSSVAYCADFGILHLRCDDELRVEIVGRFLFCQGTTDRLVTLAQSKSADEALEREMALKC